MNLKPVYTDQKYYVVTILFLIYLLEETKHRLLNHHKDFCSNEIANDHNQISLYYAI